MASALALSPWSYWLLFCLLAAGWALQFNSLARQQNWALPYLYPILFLILLRNPTLYAGVGITRELSALCNSIAYIWLIRDRGINPFVLGVFAGIAFFSQPNEVLVLLPLMIWTFAVAPWSILRQALGFSLVATIFITYFVYHSAFKDFIDAAFLFNLNTYIPKYEASASRSLLLYSRLEEIGLVLPLLITLALGPLRIAGHRILSERTYLILGAAIVMQLLSSVISAKVYHQYFIGLAPLTLLTLSHIQAGILARLKIRARALFSALILVLVFIIPLYRTVNNLTLTLSRSPHLNSTASNTIVLDALLKDLSGIRGSFYLIGDSQFLWLNTEHGIIAPSRWVYQHIWAQLPAWDPQATKVSEILASLDKYQTRYILVIGDVQDIFGRPSLALAVERFLDLKYQLIELPLQGEWKVYQRQHDHSAGPDFEQHLASAHFRP